MSQTLIFFAKLLILAANVFGASENPMYFINITHCKLFYTKLFFCTLAKLMCFVCFYNLTSRIVTPFDEASTPKCFN